MTSMNKQSKPSANDGPVILDGEAPQSTQSARNASGDDSNKNTQWRNHSMPTPTSTPPPNDTTNQAAGNAMTIPIDHLAPIKQDISIEIEKIIATLMTKRGHLRALMILIRNVQTVPELQGIVNNITLHSKFKLSMCGASLAGIRVISQHAPQFALKNSDDCGENDVNANVKIDFLMLHKNNIIGKLDKSILSILDDLIDNGDNKDHKFDLSSQNHEVEQIQIILMHLIHLAIAGLIDEDEVCILIRSMLIETISTNWIDELTGESATVLRPLINTFMESILAVVADTWINHLIAFIVRNPNCRDTAAIWGSPLSKLVLEMFRVKMVEGGRLFLDNRSLQFTIRISEVTSLFCDGMLIRAIKTLYTCEVDSAKNKEIIYDITTLYDALSNPQNHYKFPQAPSSDITDNSIAAAYAGRIHPIPKVNPERMLHYEGRV